MTVGEGADTNPSPRPPLLRFPIPNSQFPIPGRGPPIPDLLFPIPNP
ncbi:hypothetical protein LC55x_4237 [Lysobacter capsici]|nr:hypothetical protein LC55x_4237 [Lysobacter capsici]